MKHQSGHDVKAANRPLRARRLSLVVALLVLLAGMSACSDGDDDKKAAGAKAASGQFGGALEGTDALVGVVTGKERVTVYVCADGTISEWFITDTPKDELKLVSKGGAVVNLAIADDAVTGKITLADGTDHEFRATPQSKPVIHRAEAASEDAALLAGWVTVGDRTTGALNTSPIGAKTVVSPAPSLPTTPTNQVTLPAPTVSLSTTLVAITGDSTFVTPNRPMTFVVAGVGDSYASGEGNPVSAPDEVLTRPSPGSLDTMWGPTFGMNGCHRSDNAGIPTAFTALKNKYPAFTFKLAFVACGGSQIEHVTGRPPEVGPPASGDSFGAGKRGDAVASPTVASERTDRWQAINEPAQLKQVNDQVSGFGAALPVDLLVMSIGGNDGGFAPVIGKCILGGAPANVLDAQADELALAALVLQEPQECDDNPALAEALDENGPPTGSPIKMVPGWAAVLRRYAALDSTLQAFAARQRPIGQVLITEYGAGLKNTSGSAYCGGRSATTANDLFGFIDTDEAAWIDANLIGGLNSTVERAVTAANVGAAGPYWQAVKSHVAAFKNHGPCAAQPWTHINAEALAAQGNSLPDRPDDYTRLELAGMNSALVAAKGAVVGCGIGNFTVPLLGCAVGGQVGAGVGAIVGFADAEKSAVSAGMAHPNALGWQAVADALLPQFDAVFKRTFQVLQPNRARQFSARENGDIVVRWDDRASTETFYEAEVYPMTGTTAVFRQTLPANATEFTYKPGKAFTGMVQVRACNSIACSPFSVRLKVTNVKPGVPTNLSALTYGNQALAADLPDSLVVSATDPNNADTATRIELKQLTDAAGTSVTANTQTFNVAAPFPSAFLIGGANGLTPGRYRVRVASCNLFGCSAFSTSKDSSAAPPGPPNLELGLLPPFVVDKLGLARPRVGPQVPPPGPSGPPTTAPNPGP